MCSWSCAPHLLVHQQFHEKSEVHLCSAALAIAAAFNKVSACSVLKLVPVSSAFSDNYAFSGPSDEFLALCKEQLDLSRAFLSSPINFTVYVRSEETYRTGEIKLRYALSHSCNSLSEFEIGNELAVLLNLESESHTVSIRDAELALAECRIVELSESGTLILPMAKDSFLVGILVVKVVSHEPEKLKFGPEEQELSSVSQLQQRSNFIDSSQETYIMDRQSRANLIQMTRCLALACVMDQRVALLRQASWMESVQTENFIEQVQGPLTTIRTLGKMILPMLKRGEIPRDVVEDILVQANRMKDVFRWIQQNPSKKSRLGTFEPKFKLTPKFEDSHNPLRDDHLSSTQLFSSSSFSTGRDRELPMPPMTLAPLYNQNIRTCNVGDVLLRLVRGANGLALEKHQSLRLSSSHATPLIAAVDENVLQHALSGLLEAALQHSPAGGWVRVEVMQAPGGGVLIIVEDNGPDMSILMQEQILSPIGSGVKAFSYESKENVICNLENEIAYAREILDVYGIVLRIKSPYLDHAPVGSGGIRLEIWLPVPPTSGQRGNK